MKDQEQAAAVDVEKLRTRAKLIRSLRLFIDRYPEEGYVTVSGSVPWTETTQKDAQEYLIAANPSAVIRLLDRLAVAEAHSADLELIRQDLHRQLAASEKRAALYLKLTEYAEHWIACPAYRGDGHESCTCGMTNVLADAVQFKQQRGQVGTESAPCGGNRCHQSADGAWIHSSKSYGTCSVIAGEDWNEVKP